RKKFHRCHDVVGASSAWRLHQVQDAAITRDLDAIESEGRPRAIAHELFAARVITLRDPYAAVDVDAVVLCRETALLAIEVVVVRSCARGGSAEEGAGRERDTREGIDGCPSLVSLPRSSAGRSST